MIQAKGAAGGSFGGAGSGGGSGGGGRIAIWRRVDNWVGTLSYPTSVTNGLPAVAALGGGPGTGTVGTLVFGLIPAPAGTIIIIR